MEKADYRYRAYQVVLGIALLMALGAGIAWFFSRNIWIALVVGVICFSFPSSKSYGLNISESQFLKNSYRMPLTS
ncbi:hypothetical protein [Aliamphritea spongicola]|nr:hypothetical protein [Aliamphritea spongicola]